MPEAKPRDTNMPRVLSLLDNDKSTLLVPEAKPRDTNNIFFYYFYVAYVLDHYLIVIRLHLTKIMGGYPLSISK